MVATIYLLEHAEEEVWPISENEQSEEQSHDEQPEHPLEIMEWKKVIATVHSSIPASWLVWGQKPEVNNLDDSGSI